MKEQFLTHAKLPLSPKGGSVRAQHMMSFQDNHIPAKHTLGQRWFREGIK